MLSLKPRRELFPVELVFLPADVLLHQTKGRRTQAHSALCFVFSETWFFLGLLGSLECVGDLAHCQSILQASLLSLGAAGLFTSHTREAIAAVNIAHASSSGTSSGSFVSLPPPPSNVYVHFLCLHHRSLAHAFQHLIERKSSRTIRRRAHFSNHTTSFMNKAVAEFAWA